MVLIPCSLGFNSSGRALMSINFKLDDRRDVDPTDDPWGRTWIGWAEDLSDEDIYKQNRGVWLLGKRSRNERMATFSHQGRVKVVVAIDDFEDVPGGKQAIIGRVLSAGDPDYDALIGTVVDAFRNPVTYQEQGDRVCACGCGARVAGTVTFLPGHDQRAVHERISKQWGSTLSFVRWFDDTYGRPE